MFIVEFTLYVYISYKQSIEMYFQLIIHLLNEKIP